MKGLPVRPACDSLALVSTLIGAAASSFSRASTRRGSFGASRSSSTVPTEMPLYCTELPSVRPVTGSLKITSYICQVLSDEYFAAHSPNSSRNTVTRMVKAPIST